MLWKVFLELVDCCYLVRLCGVAAKKVG